MVRSRGDFAHASAPPLARRARPRRRLLHRARQLAGRGPGHGRRRLGRRGRRHPDHFAGEVSSEGADEGADPVEFEPAPARRRLLLARHYRNAVRDLLGAPAAALATPPIDTAIRGFEAIAAAQVSLSDSAVELYEKSARAIAAEAMQDPARIAALLGCTPAGPDDQACHRQFVTTFGRLA